MKAPRSGAAGGVLEMELDMTKGSPFKLIVRFIIPIIIGNIFQQLYSLVDTVIVGTGGSDIKSGRLGEGGSFYQRTEADYSRYEY